MLAKVAFWDTMEMYKNIRYQNQEKMKENNIL